MLQNIKPVQNYSKIFPGSRFTYYGAFENMEDFIGYDMVSKLYQLSEEEGKKRFDCLIKVRRGELVVPTTVSYITKEFVN